MKKTSLFQFATIGFIALLTLLSCRKINESTLIGGDLIPAVDNINTFETFLPADSTRYAFADDSTRFFFGDYGALGRIIDPVFGTTTANLYFNLSLPAVGTNPFGQNNTITIDSVVLSLAYVGAYGDTTAGSRQTVSVFEIAPTANFRSDTVYPFTTSDFAVGVALANKTYSPSALKDTMLIVRKDTTKVANVLRIRIDKNYGERISKLDSAGFSTDSAFRSRFKGLAVKTESVTGNGTLAYFNLADQQKTHLTIYYKSTANGVTDTTSIRLAHFVNGQANVIARQPGGEYAAYASQGRSPEGKLYIQSTPGSYVSLRIPALDTFKNKVIHRAELIVTKLPSTLESVFSPPSRLYLDARAGDTAYLFQNDLPVGLNGDVDFGTFGGTLRADDTYRFTLTRHVQSIISKGERNLPMRLYAPLRTENYLPGFKVPLPIAVLAAPALGRVVIAGGQYVNPSQRMRLRVIYSNL